MTENELKNTKLSISSLEFVLGNVTDSIMLIGQDRTIVLFNQPMSSTIKLLTGKDLTKGTQYNDHLPAALSAAIEKVFLPTNDSATISEKASVQTIAATYHFGYTITPASAEEGNVTAVFVTIKDIEKTGSPEIGGNRMNGGKAFRKLVELSSEAIILLGPEGNALYQTPSAEKISGYKLQEVSDSNNLHLVHPDDQTHDNAIYVDFVKQPGSIMHNRHRIKHKNGNYVWIDATYRNLLHDPEVNAIVLTYTDITEIAETEKRLEKANRELFLLNNINDLILREQDELRLLDAVCNCIIDTGGYKLAWICYLPEKEEEFLTPLVAKGATSYLKNLHISLNIPELAKGPTASVFRTGNVVITNNVSDSATFKPWLENALKHGISASIVLPIRFNESIGGTLNIYSGQTNAFDTHEVNILQRLADNVSIAIQNIRIRKEMEQTRHQLKERVKELTTIYNVNRILQNEHLPTEVIFSDIVEILPAGWQYPEICAAMISFDDQVFHTANYTDEAANLSKKFNLIDGRTGHISVCYIEERKQEDEGPFLKEEAFLLESIAETITVYFNKAAQQRSLITSEANFRGSFENAAIGMSLVHIDGRYFKVNKALCKMLGYSAEELYCLNFRDVTHPEDATKEDVLIKELINGETDYFRSEKRYIHKNGNIIWGNINISIIRDTNGAPTHLVSQVENITSRKVSEQALLNSEANLRAIFDTTEVSYILVDTDFNIKMFNPYFYKEYAYQTGIELKNGKNFLKLLLPEKRDHVENIYRKVLATSVSEEYETMYDNIQPIRYFNVLVAPVISNNEVIGLCIASQDITRRKNLELEKQHMIKDLIQRNRDLEEFGHIVSHNIRGPLSTLLGINNLLKEQPPENEEQRYLLDGISATSDKLDVVIRDLNEILQVRRGSLEPKTIVTLNEVLADIYSGLKEMIAESKADIIYDFSKQGELFTVRGYMYNIFYNLITNSIRFSKPGTPPVLKIWSEKDEHNLILYFRDNGIGIDLKRYGQKMFMLYQRFHPATEGKGLGLFMIKTQLESLNGKIEVESQPGEGSTFRVTLPMS